MKVTLRRVLLFAAALLAVKPVADFSAALPDLAFLVMTLGIALAVTIALFTLNGVRRIEIPHPASWFDRIRRR
ncbi:MAG: hypothetical protein A3F33_00355 [Candidatus Woykebacteria bacterium RIFCSPHIGHO2_12_FULL_43_10]|uniref:Uncharacterized protein n=1 Tax=Candidatus Woykebacteria bacterium RIFCSPLOWO2_01_FULL_43_14 TaxID=1802605 RepID=A0A1G1WYJ1_9BACT|nr:MAG: hypothetical protein A3F33_00355 [Candidatus Woykebacteria bacterium RIFCSPHIGHO2_12_FULL_43_10]OGY32832.1 MAG: hypothetical protein A3A61_01985 [Candidatus Woykebacteria bacterium RIFCSPLOWO2_01_FULL_43_14]